MEINNLFNELIPKIDQRLDALILEKEDGINEARKAMRYSLLNGG